MPWCMTCGTMSHQWIPWDTNYSERKWHHIKLPASQQYQATGVKVSSIGSGFKFHSIPLKLAHFSATPKLCSWDSVLLTWCWILLLQPWFTFIFKAQGCWCDARKSSFDTANGGFVGLCLENVPDMVPFTSRKFLIGLPTRSTLSAYPS